MKMELQPKYFGFVKNGTKRIELRLYDEKRKSIKLNDIITFVHAKTGEEINVKVIGLIRYNNFSDLFKDFDISIFSDKSMTKEDLLNDLEVYYNKEKQNNFGVLGIRFILRDKKWDYYDLIFYKLKYMIYENM